MHKGNGHFVIEKITGLHTGFYHGEEGVSLKSIDTAEYVYA